MHWHPPDNALALPSGRLSKRQAPSMQLNPSVAIQHRKPAREAHFLQSARREMARPLCAGGRQILLSLRVSRGSSSSAACNTSGAAPMRMTIGPLKALEPPCDRGSAEVISCAAGTVNVCAPKWNRVSTGGLAEKRPVKPRGAVTARTTLWLPGARNAYRWISVRLSAPEESSSGSHAGPRIRPKPPEEARPATDKALQTPRAFLRVTTLRANFCGCVMTWVP
jgi:hypothetical protein